MHARLGGIPGYPLTAIVTMSKMRLRGSDEYYSIHEMGSDDGGKTWSEPVEHADTLGHCDIGDGVQEGVADWWPAWHAASGAIL